MTTAETKLCGKQIQHDNSGVGHNWHNIAADSLTPDERAELECEIIDGKRETCEDFVAANGLHYRW